MGMNEEGLTFLERPTAFSRTLILTSTLTRKSLEELLANKRLLKQS